MHFDTHHRKRCQRINTPGHCHYLTFSCFHRRPFLLRDRTRNWFIDAIVAAKDKHPFDIFAWVIMPEHAHLLIRPTAAEPSISAILKSIKLPVALRAIAYLDKNNPAGKQLLADRQPDSSVAYRFWQRGGGYDRNLVSANEIWEKIDYIHRNPVRRGLVARTIDWAWSSAGEYASGDPGPLPLAYGVLPDRPQRR